ncbi:MAG: hypothetical protein U1F68_21495, partial [Gammaproteobacteria bacterium]
GEQPDMANRIAGRYVATENQRSLETQVIEDPPALLVRVEQHRDTTDKSYSMGDHETLCWPAGAGVLLE